MDAKEALQIANKAIAISVGRYLNDLESDLFCACWSGESYASFADRRAYSIDHIKATGAKLWKELFSVALGEPINLKNFKQALERYKQKQADACLQAPQTDWGEAPDVSLFYGREVELKSLKGWIVIDRCRAIVLLGIGGIGKTTLSVKLAQEVQPEFEFVVWRSLREAPPLETILDDVLDILSKHQEMEFPPTLDRKITNLISYLRNARCLLVLDNFEAVFQGGTHTGQYREGYESYGKFLRRVGESQHQSCVLMTSREKPGELATLEGSKLPVRSFRVTGLQAAAQEILVATGIVGSEAEQQELIRRYDGHPQALMLATTSIHELFAGRIADFLLQETVSFNGISRLLDEQFNRLSNLEQTILYWLAINREPVTIAILLDDIVPQPTHTRLLSRLEDLRGRSLIETNTGGYTLQNVVMEYVTNQLVEKMQAALSTQQIDFFNRYALIKATAKDYVKETQVRLILNPILVGVHDIRIRLAEILALLKSCNSYDAGYAGGNLFNLYTHLEESLHHVDFSHLTLWQADLQKDDLHHINFAYAAFAKSSFRQPLGFIPSVSFHPDGKRLIVGTSTGEIRVWGVADFQEVAVLRGHTNWVWQIIFGIDGQSLISCSADGTIKLWQMDGTTGQCLQTLQGHTDEVYSVALSPDGQLLVSGSRDRTIKRWSVPTGECLQTIQERTNAVCAVAFSPDGQLFASSGYDKTIKLWQSDTGQCVQTLEGHLGELSTLAFSPDGQILAIGGYECTVKLWRISTGECLKTLEGHTSRVSCVQFSPDGQWLVSSTRNRNIKLWRVSTGECLKNFQEHTDFVRSVAFSPDGQLLASGGDDQTVKLWQVGTGECLRTWRGYGICVWSVTFSPDGKCLASANHNHAVRLWSVEAGNCEQTLWGHEDCVWAVVFSPTGEWLASAGNEPGVSTLRLWHLKTGECLKLMGHLAAVHAIAFSSDGQLLASCGIDLMIKIWQVDIQQCVQTLRGHTHIIRSVSFSPDGQLLVTCSDDRTIKLWDVSTGECLKTFIGDKNWVWSVAFSPDGQSLASCGDDGIIKLWQVQTEKCIKRLQGHRNAIYMVRFSPDGTMLASAGSDGTIRLWDAKTGACFQIIQAHTGEIWSIAFSPNGRQLASGSEDGTIKLWKVKTGACLKILEAPRPYEGMNITGVTGITEAQKASLRCLGAVELSQ